MAEKEGKTHISRLQISQPQTEFTYKLLRFRKRHSFYKMSTAHICQALTLVQVEILLIYFIPPNLCLYLRFHLL